MSEILNFQCEIMKDLRKPSMNDKFNKWLVMNASNDFNVHHNLYIIKYS
jgi:hypothetical protein